MDEVEEEEEEQDEMQQEQMETKEEKEEEEDDAVEWGLESEDRQDDMALDVPAAAFGQMQVQIRSYVVVCGCVWVRNAWYT